MLNSASKILDVMTLHILVTATERMFKPSDSSHMVLIRPTTQTLTASIHMCTHNLAAFEFTINVLESS